MKNTITKNGKTFFLQHGRIIMEPKTQMNKKMLQKTKMKKQLYNKNTIQKKYVEKTQMKKIMYQKKQIK